MGHISHLAVAPEYQHKGVGHLLLETVEKRARELGFTIIGTIARSTATSYFERAGFRVAGIPTVLRANIDNVLDRHYWLLSGTYATVATGRTVVLSASFDF